MKKEKLDFIIERTINKLNRARNNYEKLINFKHFSKLDKSVKEAKEKVKYYELVLSALNELNRNHIKKEKENIERFDY